MYSHRWSTFLGVFDRTQTEIRIPHCLLPFVLTYEFCFSVTTNLADLRKNLCLFLGGINITLTRNIVHVGFDHWNSPFSRQRQSFLDRLHKLHYQSRIPGSELIRVELALFDVTPT